MSFTQCLWTQVQPLGDQLSAETSTLRGALAGICLDPSYAVSSCLPLPQVHLAEGLSATICSQASSFPSHPSELG